jgi:hypothetical protein
MYERLLQLVRTRVSAKQLARPVDMSRGSVARRLGGLKVYACGHVVLPFIRVVGTCSRDTPGSRVASPGGLLYESES